MNHKLEMDNSSFFTFILTALSVPLVILLLYRIRYLFIYPLLFCLKMMRDTHFSISNKRGYKILSYYDDGHRRKLYIPTRPDMSLTASSCCVLITHKDGITEHMDQDSSFPILVTCEDLKADHVIVKNKHTGLYRVYKGNEKIEYV